MKQSKRVITRRDFLRTGSYMAMGGLIRLPLMAHATANKTAISRVVLIRDENMTDVTDNPFQVRSGKRNTTHYIEFFLLQI